MKNEKKMFKQQQKRNGVSRLIEEFRSRFRIPENINNYAEDTYREAERRFIKLLLLGKLP